MAINNPSRSKASSTNTTTSRAFASTAPASPLPDLLAGLRWGAREFLVAAAALILIDVFAGWSYLTSYFGYFRIPVEGLGLTMPEVLGQGLRSILLPLTVVFFSALAPARHLRQGAIAIALYLLFLAAVALGNHWASPGSVVAQLAASVALGGLVFAIRLGFGKTRGQRLVMGAIGLLLLISIPIATGTLDATQKASAKDTTLRIVTNTPILPNESPSNGLFAASTYVLLRESDTRYWLFRIGGQNAYSISKSDVLYIRY
ncbi:MAG TPA: hypothetical protein VIO37_03380 [Candidatus Dormibacteraeota bacterium]